MATLGKFKKENGVYEGVIERITYPGLPTRILPVQAKSATDAPDYPVYRSQSEVGAAWKKKTRTRKRYLVGYSTTRHSRKRFSGADWSWSARITSCSGPANNPDFRPLHSPGGPHLLNEGRKKPPHRTSELGMSAGCRPGAPTSAESRQVYRSS